MTGKCATCRFYVAQGSECRRFPPQLTLYPTDNQHPLTYLTATQWPNVYETAWCGEWKTLEEPKS